MSQPIHRIASVLAACLLASGCITQLTAEEVEERLSEAGRPYGADSRRQLIPIYAETTFVARALLTEAQANPESPLAVHVSKRLGAASKRGAYVVVGGPYPELNDRVLRNALVMHRDEGLDGITLVYVSNARPSLELTRAVQQVEARLRHRALP